MKIAVVGATGLVGGEILEVMEERNVQFDELLLVASAYWISKLQGSSLFGSLLPIRPEGIPSPKGCSKGVPGTFGMAWGCTALLSRSNSRYFPFPNCGKGGQRRSLYRVFLLFFDVLSKGLLPTPKGSLWERDALGIGANSFPLSAVMVLMRSLMGLSNSMVALANWSAFLLSPKGIPSGEFFH